MNDEKCLEKKLMISVSGNHPSVHEPLELSWATLGNSTSTVLQSLSPTVIIFIASKPKLSRYLENYKQVCLIWTEDQQKSES